MASSRVNPDGYEDQVWTDNEQSRYVIWEAYTGFVEHYNNYEMFVLLGRNNPVINAGLWRYSVSLYEEIRSLAYHFRKFLSDEPRNYDFDKIDEIMIKRLLFKDNNLNLMRRYFNDVLYVSGIKNIIFRRDKRDGLQKIKAKYDIEQKVLNIKSLLIKHTHAWWLFITNCSPSLLYLLTLQPPSLYFIKWKIRKNTDSLFYYSYQ